MVLRSPSGQNVILMSDVGGGTDVVNANLVFSDAATANVPAVIVSGTYRPTNTAGPDNFPAPGPGNITNVNPTLATFSGNPNGNWNLYIFDQFGDLNTISISPGKVWLRPLIVTDCTYTPAPPAGKPATAIADG